MIKGVFNTLKKLTCMHRARKLYCVKLNPPKSKSGEVVAICSKCGHKKNYTIDLIGWHHINNLMAKKVILEGTPEIVEDLLKPHKRGKNEI